MTEENVKNLGEIPKNSSLILQVFYDDKNGSLNTVNDKLPIPNEGKIHTTVLERSVTTEDWNRWNRRTETRTHTEHTDNPSTEVGPMDLKLSSYTTPFGFYSFSNSSKSFTLAMFLRPSDSNPTPILSQITSIYRNKWRFSLLSNDRNIELHIHNADDEEFPPKTTKIVTFGNALRQSIRYWNQVSDRHENKKVFTFFAITYDNSKEEVTLFDNTATIFERFQGVKIDASDKYENEGGMFVGSASRNGTLFNVNTRDLGLSSSYDNRNQLASTSAIGCLSFFNQVLTDVEIASLQCACQFKGKKSDS